MTDKAYGWVVTVSTPMEGGDEPMLQIFDVAIGDARDAMDKVKRRVKADGDTTVIVKSQLTKAQVAALKLEAGEARERNSPKKRPREKSRLV
jgi:hypothetical protein